MIQAPQSGGGNSLIYADLGPSSSKIIKPSHTDDDHRVVYSQLNHTAPPQQPVHPKEPQHDTCLTSEFVW